MNDTNKNISIFEWNWSITASSGKGLVSDNHEIAFFNTMIHNACWNCTSFTKMWWWVYDRNKKDESTPELCITMKVSYCLHNIGKLFKWGMKMRPALKSSHRSKLKYVLNLLSLTSYRCQQYPRSCPRWIVFRTVRSHLISIYL